jgi:Lsr2
MAVGMMDETDGSQADETVHFGLDGAEFELNLSKAHAEELRHVFEPYIKAGRKTGSKRNGRPATDNGDWPTSRVHKADRTGSALAGPWDRN